MGFPGHRKVMRKIPNLKNLRMARTCNPKEVQCYRYINGPKYQICFISLKFGTWGISTLLNNFVIQFSRDFNVRAQNRYPLSNKFQNVFDCAEIRHLKLLDTIKYFCYQPSAKFWFCSKKSVPDLYRKLKHLLDCSEIWYLRLLDTPKYICCKCFQNSNFLAKNL